MCRDGGGGGGVRGGFRSTLCFPSCLNVRNTCSTAPAILLKLISVIQHKISPLSILMRVMDYFPALYSILN